MQVVQSLPVNLGKDKDGKDIKATYTTLDATNSLDESSVHVSGDETISGVKTFTSGVVLNGGELKGNITFDKGSTYSIGNESKKLKELWADEVHISQNTLYVGDVPVIGSSADTIVVKADPDQSLQMKTSGEGISQVVSESGINLSSVGANSTINVSSKGSNSSVNVSADKGINLTASEISLNGTTTIKDLNVIGTTTTVNSEDLKVKDNVIELNSGENGNGVTKGTAGIKVNRGDALPYLIQFDESDDLFKVGEQGDLETIASRPYVDDAVSTKANDSDVVHKSGDETISGNKSFNNDVTFNGNLNIKHSADNGLIRIQGGSGEGKGARIVLSGASRPSWNGAFNLVAQDSSSISTLSGYPNGSLTWGGSSFSCTNGELGTSSNKWKDVNTVLLNGKTPAYADDLSNYLGITAKAESAKSADSVTWDNVSGKPSSYTPSSHNHDSSYLKLSGGTLTGTLVQKNLTLNDGVHDATCIVAHDEGTGYGSELVIGAGGNVYIGSGESHSNWYNENGISATENMYISSDGTINFATGCQTISNKKVSYIDTDGSYVGNVKGNVTGNCSGTAANVTGTVTIANGGTGATNRLNAFKNLTNESVGEGAQYFITITSNWGKAGYSSVAQAKKVLGIDGVANVDASKAIVGITRSGTTFTYTCIDGTTGTFTQQDNNTTYASMSASEATTGTSTTARSISAKVLNDKIDEKVSALVNSAPETLDTLNELASALGNDPNFATTVSNQIGTKANDNSVVHKTGNETISGIKTFSNTQTYFGRDVCCYSNAKYGKSLNPTTTSCQYVFFYGNAVSDGTTNNWYGGYLEQVVNTNGSSRGRWLVRDTSESPVGIELWVSGDDKQIRPYQNNNTNLGDAERKFKDVYATTLHGDVDFPITAEQISAIVV